MIAAIAAFCVRYVILGLMLSIGLEATPDDLRQMPRDRQLYLRALLVVEIAVPLLAILVTWVVPVPRGGTELILLMAACPGAPFVPFVTRSKGERYSAVGLNLLLLTAALAPITVPAWVWVLRRFYGYDLGITPLQVFQTVASSILIPLLAGIAFNRYWPRVTRVLRPVTFAFVIVGLLIAIVYALYVGFPTILDVARPTLLAMFLMVAGSIALGGWAARHTPQARRATAECAALGNPALALAIVAVSYPGFKALPFVAAYIILRRIYLTPFDVWLKRQHPPQEGTPAKKNRRSGWTGRRLSTST